MDKFVEMDYDEWLETYKPILNHIEPNSSFDGMMFETYGDEVEFVKSQSPDKIWMYGEGDDSGSFIWSGWGFVNRLGYFITEVPFPPDTTIQIKVSDPDYECGGCGSYYSGDEAIEILDKFAMFDFESCPDCATIEQLKKIEEING
jgi:hypothetical protein